MAVFRGAALHSGDETSFKGHVAVGHARRVECETGMALAIEENQPAGAMRPFRKQMNSFTSGQLGGGNAAVLTGRHIHADRHLTQEVDGSFGHHDFHDGFAVAGTGDAARFGIGITATADQRRIADAARKFAASATGGCGGEQISALVDGDRPDGPLLMSAMMPSGVLVSSALEPSLALGFADELLGFAKRNSLLRCEALRPFCHQHHVRTIVQDGSGKPNGVLHALQCRGRPGTQRRAIHDHGVALHAAVQIQMGTVACVENRVVFQYHDSGFDGVESIATFRKDGPAGSQGALTARFTGIDGLVRNVPGAAVNNQSRSHRTENRKACSICPLQSRKKEIRDTMKRKSTEKQKVKRKKNER